MTAASGKVRARRKKADPVRPWARRLMANRPGLVESVLEGVAEKYGKPTWRRVHDPTSELILTILSQNSADINAEKAFEALREAYPMTDPPAQATTPPDGSIDAADKVNRPGWGGVGLDRAAAPDWMAVESAPLDELVKVIRPGGLAATEGADAAGLARTRARGTGRPFARVPR